VKEALASSGKWFFGTALFIIFFLYYDEFFGSGDLKAENVYVTLLVSVLAGGLAFSISMYEQLKNSEA
jgi:hypothetical protein